MFTCIAYVLCGLTIISNLLNSYLSGIVLYIQITKLRFKDMSPFKVAPLVCVTISNVSPKSRAPEPIFWPFHHALIHVTSSPQRGIILSFFTVTNIPRMNPFVHRYLWKDVCDVCILMLKSQPDLTMFLGHRDLCKEVRSVCVGTGAGHPAATFLKMALGFSSPVA